MKRIIIMGSPRSNGRSAHLAEMLFEANIDERPEDELFLVPVSEIEVGPCIACNACREQMEIILRDEHGNEVRELRHRCVFDDDMQTLYDLIDDADELTVVSPVFFSGSPSLLKALLDRLQPYYWARRSACMDGGEKDRESAKAHEEAATEEVKAEKGADAGIKREGSEEREASTLVKRPATLHVIGEGGDPHGYDALVSEVKSALAVAGFRLERIFDWIGKIDETGEITADAEETVLVQSETTETPAAHAGTHEAVGAGDTFVAYAGASEDIGMGEKSGRGALRAPAEQGAHSGPQNPSKGETPHSAKPRSKFDLSAAGKQPSKRGKGKGNRRG